MSELGGSPSRLKAQGVLIYEHSQAPMLLESLRPDNTSDIYMELQANRIVIRVTSPSLRTLIATCDDLFANLQVATEALATVQI